MPIDGPLKQRWRVGYKNWQHGHKIYFPVYSSLISLLRMWISYGTDNGTTVAAPYASTIH